MTQDAQDQLLGLIKRGKKGGWGVQGCPLSTQAPSEIGREAFNQDQSERELVGCTWPNFWEKQGRSGRKPTPEFVLESYIIVVQHLSRSKVVLLKLRMGQV